MPVVSIVPVQSTDALKASMVVFVGDKGFSVASGGVELDLFRGHHLGFDVWCLRPLRQGFVVRRCELSDVTFMLTNSPDSIVRAWVCFQGQNCLICVTEVTVGAGQFCCRPGSIAHSRVNL